MNLVPDSVVIFDPLNGKIQYTNEKFDYYLE